MQRTSELSSPPPSTEAWLAALVDSSTDAIIGKTLTGLVASWNRGAERMFGYSAAEMVGKDISQLAAPDNVEEEAALAKRVVAGESIDSFETVRVRKDGKAIFIAMNASRVLDPSGKLIGISSIARDITEKRLADEQRRASSQYARSLIEASLDPLVTISPEGKITDVNDATVKITGIPLERLIGTDFSDYFTEPDKARVGYQQVFSRGSVTDYPLTIRHSHGRLSDVLYNASVYRDQRGSTRWSPSAARERSPTSTRRPSRSPA